MNSFRICSIILAAFAVLFEGSMFMNNSVYAKTNIKICVVHSYPENSAWAIDFSHALKDHIEHIDAITFKHYYIEKKDIHSDRKKLENALNIKKEILEEEPFLLICSDEEAYHYVARSFFDSEIPIIVSGLNGSPIDYDLIHDNVVAVFEQENITDSIDFAKSLLPRLRKVAILSDRSTASLKAIDIFARKEHSVKIIAYRLIEFFSVWKERVERYEMDADAILINKYQSLFDEQTNEKVPPAEVINWTLENCNIPTIGCFDYEIEEGVFCGKVHSGYSIGFETAKLANNILEGINIEDLSSVIVARKNTMLNLRTAKKLNITIPPEVLAKIDKVIE